VVQNIGLYASDGTAPGDLTMIIAPEQSALKAREQFEAPRDFVRRAAEDGQRIDAVEREVLRQLLSLGHTLLGGLVAVPLGGDLGPEAEAPGGRVVRRLPGRHDRRYVSTFGEPTGTRVAYGTRERQSIERVPLDKRLGPARLADPGRAGVRLVVWGRPRLDRRSLPD
jgi:hypothetical protein